MTTRDTRRVAVVGGGILGASTAAALARHGAKVTLFTEGRFCSGASGRSLAWLNSHDRWSAEYRNLRLLGLDRYRTFASRVEGASSYLRFDGGLTWHAPGEFEDRRHAFEHMRRVGYAAQWVSAEEVPAADARCDTSAISPEGAIFNPQEGWVELPRLVSHLVDAAPCPRPAMYVPRADRAGSRSAEAASPESAPAPARSFPSTTPSSPPAPMSPELGRTRDRLAGCVDSPLAHPHTTLRYLPPCRPQHTTRRRPRRPQKGASSATPHGRTVRSDRRRRNVPGAREDSAKSARETSAVLDGHPSLTYESYGVGLKPIPGDGDPVLGFLEEITAITSPSPTAARPSA